MRTFVPLLQLLLVEVGRFLEIGEFLLGQLALAIMTHNQLLAPNLYMLHSATGSQFLLQRANGICESGVACCPVLGVSWLVGVGAGA
jgi:hypothetical protein